ncbi:MAG TPA: hypothetical protein VGH09_01955, partial [Solirubrobacteraceae bacterium]
MLESSVPVAHELLGQCIKQGQALVQRASLVGDLTDYEAWKAARKQWIDPTTKALEHLYDGPREAREFADAVTCPDADGPWQQQYAADLDCVNSALELLTVLQGELALDAGTGSAALTQATDASAQEVRHPELEAGAQDSSSPAGLAAIDGSPVVEQRVSAASPAEPDERSDPDVALRERERPLDEGPITDQQQAPLEQSTPAAAAPGEEPQSVGAELERAPVVGAELATP